MPLSDHEQRLLDEIEHTLRLDDPALASSLRSARPVIRTRTFLLLAVIGLIAGIVSLAVGLRLHGIPGPVLGCVGFVLIVAGVDLGLRVVTRVRQPADGKTSGPRRER
jgi:hypothetical protein